VLLGERFEFLLLSLEAIRRFTRSLDIDIWRGGAAEVALA
jgi:hypothetical protein